MSETGLTRHAYGADRHESGVVTSLSTADWLSFAAMPSFALMAVLAASAGGPAEALCVGASGPPLLGGMAPMYVLMSVIHCAPWVDLIARRRRYGPRTEERAAR